MKPLPIIERLNIDKLSANKIVVNKINEIIDVVNDITYEKPDEQE